jgi:predicted amino acid dehydrogenase
MHRFAFIIHPIDVRRDVARKYPVARILPERLIERVLLAREPQTVATITGLRSPSGCETEGWLIGCPLSPKQFRDLPVEQVYARLEKCGRIAEELGAGILGLGAFTSVVGDGGITLSRRLSIPVTTGNSYTVATALEGTLLAANRMGIEPGSACAAVIGATGSIGATCAGFLASAVREVVLIGRNQEKLDTQARQLREQGGAQARACTEIAEGLREADLVIAVSSAAEAIVQPEHIKKGAVVCDVARPRDVSKAVAKTRDDVLVIEGGLVCVPGEMRCVSYERETPFSFGFPPGTAYACMSETMALAMEGRLECFTIGKTVSLEQVREIAGICERQGFRLDGFRSFERAVSDAEVEAIRERAGRPPLAPTASGALASHPKALPADGT